MRRQLTRFALAVVVGTAAYAASAVATPSSGFTGTTIAQGVFGEIDVKNFTVPANWWQARLKTQGESRVFVQANVWEPGGSTGWHTHPGHSLIIVTAGTVTAYEGDAGGCTAHAYTVGEGFVDPGGDHSHVIRNEGTVEARTTTIQLLPEGAPRRIDAPNPNPVGCPF